MSPGASGDRMAAARRPGSSEASSPRARSSSAARGRYGTEMSEDDANALVLAAQLLAAEDYPAGD